MGRPQAKARRNREHHVSGGKSKGRVMKKGKGAKSSKRASHSTKHQSRKVTEKGSVKVSKSKGASEKVNEDTETAEATTSHLKRDKAVVLSKKERRDRRRQQRGNYELTSEAKGSWERLRRHQLPNSERKQLMDKLLTAITGQIHQLSVKHDTARVIQCCLKYGSRDQRTSVFNELKDHIVELSKLKYAKFTVKSLMKYCTASERGVLIDSLYGHVRRLVRHTEAAEILEIAYNDYANASQRAALVSEFYGPQFSLFKAEANSATLAELLKDKPDQRVPVLKHIKDTILPLIDKKKVMQHSIVHRVLYEFFRNCTAEERAEMVECVREVVVHMLHTKEGSRVAMMTLWHGTAKDRKAVLKSFKTYVAKICKEENGHLVLMALFDCVDDTVLVKKVILSELLADMGDLCDDPYARRVLLYLLAPRSPTHFSPQFISVLSAGDGNAHSKKDQSVRWEELRERVVAPLVALASGRSCLWARSKCHAPLLLQIADSAPSKVDLSSLYSTLVEGLSLNFDPENHLVSDASAHWVLKRLLANQEKGKGLAWLILEKLPVDQLVLWSSSNRGAFVLCALVAHLEQGNVDHLKLATALREALTMSVENGAPLKGQQALTKELSKYFPQADKS